MDSIFFLSLWQVFLHPFHIQALSSHSLSACVLIHSPWIQADQAINKVWTECNQMPHGLGHWEYVLASKQHEQLKARIRPTHKIITHGNYAHNVSLGLLCTLFRITALDLVMTLHCITF